jgi:hypothetical protein
VTGLSYEDLVAAATVGLARRPLRITGLAGPAGERAGLVDLTDPAAALLEAAALVAGARRAGMRISDAAGVPAPPVLDGAPELSGLAAEALERLRPASPSVTADLLGAAARAGFVAPALLPAWLDAAVRDAGLRPAVAGVLGARGRWLAGQRPDWQQALGAELAAAGDDILTSPPGDDAGSVWRTGGRAERIGYLTGLRRRDPAAGRLLLAAGWGTETGEDRARLLAALAGGLSLADEEFLEQVLDDSRGAVRARARWLLTQLPDSDFSRRAAGRAAGLLRVEGQGPGRRLIARLPGEGPPARDGIAATPPRGVAGPAWQLTQLIAAAPLGRWPAELGLDPAQLVALPVAGDLRDDVHAGWRLAALWQASSGWAEALLAAGPPAGSVARPQYAWPRDDQLADALSPDARVARAIALLARSGVAPEAVAAAAACAPPWPDTLGRAVLAALRAAVAAPHRSSSPAALATAAARCLPPEPAAHRSSPGRPGSPESQDPGSLGSSGSPDSHGRPGSPDSLGSPDGPAGVLARLAGSSRCPPAWAAPLRRAARTLELRRIFLEEIR